MRLIGTALVVALLSGLSAGAASAADLFSAFDSYCLKTRAAAEAALAAAEADGGVKEAAPPGAIEPFNFDAYGVRRMTPGGTVVVAGRGTTPVRSGGTQATKVCFVTGTLDPTTFDRAKAALGAPLKSSPVDATGAWKDIYMFRETSAGRIAMSPADVAALDQAKGGLKESISMIVVSNLGGMKATLLYYWFVA